MNSANIIKVLKALVKDLVEERYQQVYDQDVSKDIKPLEMREAIAYYGQPLTMPPEHAFEKADIYETNDPNIVKVDLDLWFNEEQSDLTLSCTIYSNGRYGLENINML